MSLIVGLVLRLWLVIALAFGSAVTWTIADSAQTVRTEIHATQQRVVAKVESIHMLASGAPFAGVGSSALSVLSAMAPGTCVDIDGPRFSKRRLCADWNVFGVEAPDWFSAIFSAVFKPVPPLHRVIEVIGSEPYHVSTGFDPVAAITRAWQQVRIIGGTAAVMAIAIALAGGFTIARALKPVDAIVAGLNRLADGDLAIRLPKSGSREFSRIAQAANHLAARLDDGVRDRAQLMRKLLEVQDDERRQLARELHDEFGQSLTAAGAVAASIEVAAGERTDIVDDARAIGRITRQMMETLRGAFARLRPPDFDELGLEASLRTMLGGWNASLGRRTRFTLKADGDFAEVPANAAIGIYRIAQECVTNAARHGNPSEVRVELSRQSGEADADVRLTVDDDGGGSGAAIAGAAGYGILGIRERVASLGGTLSIMQTETGIRIDSLIPAGALRVPA